MKRTFSAGGIVLNANNEVLVVNQNNDSWSLPKGHLDPGEDALAAAKREILEESGVSELEMIRDLGSYERPRIARGGGDDAEELKQIRIFLFKTGQTELKPTDPGNPEARWVPYAEVEALLTHPKDKAFFREVAKSGIFKLK